jgi:3-hydroxyacyl-[acyl-carrier-protein] dehydratase
MRTLNFEQVREVLAHRFPFLMIDRVIELEPGKRVVAIKNVTGNEIHFLGHLPNAAVMPGVLIIEALAQALHISFTTSFEEGQHPAGLTYLTNASVRFLKPVLPGDRLRLEADVVKLIDYGVMGRVSAYVDDEVVAKGEIMLGNRRDI